MTGKVLISESATGGKSVIDVRGLAAGLYTVQYLAGEQVLLMKFNKL